MDISFIHDCYLLSDSVQFPLRNIVILIANVHTCICIIVQSLLIFGLKFWWILHFSGIWSQLILVNLEVFGKEGGQYFVVVVCRFFSSRVFGWIEKWVKVLYVFVGFRRQLPYYIFWGFGVFYCIDKHVWLYSFLFIYFLSAKEISFYIFYLSKPLKLGLKVIYRPGVFHLVPSF